MADSDYGDEESSVETPPPPPPTDGNSTAGADREEERYQEQLKVFQDMAEFSAGQDGEDGMNDDGSVEIPPPENYEEMGVVSKGPGSKRYCMIAVCLLALLAIVLGVGFGTGAFSGSEEESSSAERGGIQTSAPAGGSTDAPVQDLSTPAPDTRQGQIFSYITSISQAEEGVFTDPTAAEALALQWLMEEDPAGLNPEDPNDQLRLQQRYALLTLWFNSPADWFDETNWLNEDECTWVGVTCETPTPEARRARNLQEGASVVTAIELESNNLSGNIAQDLSLLVDLQVLNLARNSIGGSVPFAIESLSQLTILILNDNALTGQLTSLDLSKLLLLRILDVSSNDLNGPLPPTMYALPAIEILVMDDNNFTGEISENIGNLQTLRKYR